MDVLIKGEIVLFGTVGAKFLPDEEFFTDIDVKNALAKVGRRDVSVRINSGGGYVDHGVAIYNMLKDHPGKVNVTVDGVAASAGSVIAMAGDTITMNTSTLMMVHRASAVSIGNVDDHEKSIESLKATDNNIVDIYAGRTGRPRAEIEAEVTAETWMNPEQAVAKKYATGVQAAPALRAAAFDYSKYSNPIASMLASGWSPPPPPAAQDTPAAMAMKFWNFLKTHDKATDALAKAFDAEFKGEQLASHLAFAEIWNTACQPEATAVPVDWAPSQKIFAAIDGTWAVQAEAMRRELANVAATCSLQGKPERTASFFKRGCNQKVTFAELQAERVAAYEESHVFNQAWPNLDPGSAGVRVNQAEIDKSWEGAIDKVNARLGLQKT
ncbi:MAG: Clp protease ClpP [Mesorhizobium sp.]|nr:MAG: Clp protease ClpP [Mesorhizobium sp.]